MKKTLFLLLALSGISVAATAVSGTPYYAATSDSSGDVTVTLDSGTTGSTWAGAFGSASSEDRVGNITMTMNGSYSGSATVFGAVNSGSDNSGEDTSDIDGDICLVFDASGAEYDTFTDTDNSDNIAVSVLGAFRSTVSGKVDITINAGTFNYDIIGGGYTANSSVGSTSVTINGGNILDDVYAGGVSGTIGGNTSITISSLDAFESHTSTNLISAGGRKVGAETGGTIGGDATVTFKNIASGSYAGTVSGGSNVTGTSTLVLDNASVKLGAISDFDAIALKNNSTMVLGQNKLVFNGVMTTDSDSSLGWTITKDSGNEINIVDLGSPPAENGWSGEVTVKGLVDGTINDGSGTLNATINSCKGTYDIASDTATVAGVYYLMSGEANIGNHGMNVPAEMNDLDGAFAWYVNKGATMYVHEATDLYTMGEALKNVYGDGDIVLRSANDVPGDFTYEVAFTGKTNATGSLICNPTGTHEGYEYTKAILFELGSENASADISSFDSIKIAGNENVTFKVNSELTAEAGRGHFNNVSLESAKVIMILQEQDYHFAGETSLDTVAPENYNRSAQLSFYRTTNDSNINITIDSLVDGSELDEAYIGKWQSLYVGIGYVDTATGAAADANSVMTLNILSVNSSAYFDINNRFSSVVANFNVEKGNKFWQKQYGKATSQSAVGIATLTLTGEGTYVLNENSDIADNFGRVSSEIDSITGKHKWRGIVEVNNLIATDAYHADSTKNGFDFELYGNAESFIHFKGFKGYLFNTTEDDAYKNMTAEQNIILSNSESESTPHAFEVANGFGGQKLNFTGDFSGDGDFVVSCTGSANLTFNLSGSLSEWKNGAEFKVTGGTHQVNYLGEATTINADIVTTGGSLTATISNDAAVTVNGKVSNESGGTMNLAVETAAGTTFKNTVKVNSLTVSKGSLAKLAAESTAGGVKIKAHGAEVAELSNGLSIADSTVSGGSIRNAAITSTAAGEVELSGLTAENLYLYGGEDVVFASATTKEFVFDAESNEVNFSSDAFKGMTLSSHGAGITLQVESVVDGLTTTDVDKVTIFLEGFKMEGLAGSGEWSWEESKLNFSGAMTYNLGDTTTVQQLLMAEYQSITYTQGVNGLTIRMSNIPEPSTVSLSLLALAGLVMRRKRK